MLKPKMSTIFSVIVIAIVILVRLYLKEDKFRREFHQITDNFHPAIAYCVLGWVNSHRAALLSEDYKKAYKQLSEKLMGYTVTTENIDSCLLALDELAWKWNLRLPKPLAGFMLFIQAFFDELKMSGVTTVIEGHAFHPVSIAAPIHLTIYDWGFAELGQVGVLEQVRKSLKNYSQELHSKGMRSFPYGLEEHAEWWFARYVKGKPYKEIGVDSETIKRKVWDFRRLLHISLKK